MTDIKFTPEQLLLVLNYDTYNGNFLTINERCEIHRTKNRDLPLSKELYVVVKSLLLKLKENNYKKISAKYKENEITTEKELIILK